MKEEFVGQVHGANADVVLETALALSVPGGWLGPVGPFERPGDRS